MVKVQESWFEPELRILSVWSFARSLSVHRFHPGSQVSSTSEKHACRWISDCKLLLVGMVRLTDLRRCTDFKVHDAIKNIPIKVAGEGIILSCNFFFFLL